MHNIPFIVTDVVQTDSGAFTSISGTTRTRVTSPWTNFCAETDISAKTTTHIGSAYIEIAGKRFDSKQLAYLLSKLLEEHPECQV